MANKLLLISSAINILTLSAIFYTFWNDSASESNKGSGSDDFYDELCPTVIYNQNESVQTSFSSNGITKRGRRRFDNCINPNTTNRKLRLLYIKKCLPLFKEYKSRAKKVNRSLMKSVPRYVPTFGESNTVVDYPYDQTHWKKLYKNPMRKLNLLNKLKFYSRRKGKPASRGETLSLTPSTPRNVQRRPESRGRFRDSAHGDLQHE